MRICLSEDGAGWGGVAERKMWRKRMRLIRNTQAFSHSWTVTFLKFTVYIYISCHCMFEYQPFSPNDDPTGKETECHPWEWDWPIYLDTFLLSVISMSCDWIVTNILHFCSAPHFERPELSLQVNMTSPFVHALWSHSPYLGGFSLLKW